MNKILSLLFLSFCSMAIYAQVRISPDNKNIYVSGSNYTKMLDNELVIHRHSDTIYKGTTKSNLFNPLKARTSTGIFLVFKTNSPKVVANFKIVKGLKKGGFFTVFKNDIFYKDIPFKYEENATFSIDLSSDTDKETVYKIAFPLRTDIHFLGLELSKKGKLCALKKEKKGVYVAYGDSITHGTGQQTTPQTYAYQLAEKLNLELFNVAVGGGKTSNVLAKMVSDDFKDIDLITVLIGFNDYNGEGVTAQKYANRYEQVLSILREKHPKTKIYCITLLTTKSLNSKKTGIPATAFRKVVEDLVTKRQENGDKNLFLIKGNTITSIEDLKDHVHLNAKGAKKFANTLYDIIKK